MAALRGGDRFDAALLEDWVLSVLSRLPFVSFPLLFIPVTPSLTPEAKRSSERLHSFDGDCGWPVAGSASARQRLTSLLALSPSYNTATQLLACSSKLGEAWKRRLRSLGRSASERCGCGGSSITSCIDSSQMEAIGGAQRWLRCGKACRGARNAVFR